jgi:hypothetical protein
LKDSLHGFAILVTFFGFWIGMGFAEFYLFPGTNGAIGHILGFFMGAIGAIAVGNIGTWWPRS